MTGRVWALAAASAVLALAACSDSKSSPSSQPTAFVGITPSVSTVVANGVNTVTLNYTNTGGGSATITTDRGTFSGGGTSVTVSNASGSVDLVTCNGCSGTANVTITAAAGTATARITFQSRAVACAASCSVDPTCDGAACTLTGGGAGACTSGTCQAGTACTPSPAGAATETSCSDGLDNDCNGVKDCAETSCDGQACKAGSPTFQCVSGACTDLSTGLAVTVTPARTRLPAVAGVEDELVVEVTYLQDPAPNLTVTLSLSDATLGTVTPAAAITDSNGRARFVFTTSAVTGTEVVTAALQAMPTVTGSAILTIPRLASLRLIDPIADSVQYPVMGAKGSGWQDLGWLKVQAVDDVGLPYPDGLPVRFEHRQLGGSTLGVPLTGDVGTCTAAARCVGYQGVTASTSGRDTAGVAQAWIYSGTVAGTLYVTASASAAGASFGVSLPTMQVVGAKASGANFSVVCSPRNVPALAETNCSVSLVDAPFTCEAVLKDRFSNVLGRGTQVVFASEASAVGQAVNTPEYAGGDATGLGLAVQTFQTLGAGLPFDVAPLAALGEPGVVHGRDGCGLRTHNPRDGVVTVIAVADGEEAFFDANGNGTFDVAEPFVDLGEPYVDQDDDGVWTPGEWFLDLDGNGTFTGPNGRWDANTKIWTQTIVVYTGTAESLVPSGGRFMGTRLVDPGAFVDACSSTATPTPFDVLYETTIHPASSQSYVAVASDGNFNFLHTGTSYGASIIPTSADFEVDYFGLAKYADLPGLDWRFWPCANNGTGACASQCRASSATAPCRMRAEFTGFSCGLTTSAMVTGGTKPSGGTLSFDVTVPWEEYGSGYVEHGGAGVFGTSRP